MRSKVRPRRRVFIPREMITAFYKAVREGVFLEEPGARLRIEYRIFKAQAEGRIK